MDKSIYNEETQAFGKAILTFLTDKYGTVPEVFHHSIKILLTNYHVFIDARQDVLKRGVMIQGAKELKRNPSFKIMMDAETYVINQLKDWGLTPKAMKSLNKDDDKPDTDPDDLLEILQRL